MASQYRRTSTAVMALALVFAAGACSSESSGSTSGAASSDVVNSTGAPSSDAPTEPSSTEAPVAEAPSSEAPVAELDCDADQQAGIDAESMSRSVTVLFSADSKSGVNSADITAETTMTIQDDGTLSPATLTVAVGQVFGIMPAAGASLDAVKIGCADPQTLLPGSPAGFVITAPGTYLISLDIAGTELGTVTVQ
jgi:hypothetical protein